MEECLSKRFKCFKNFNELSMYLLEEKGVAPIHVYVWDSQPLLQNRLMDVY